MAIERHTDQSGTPWDPKQERDRRLLAHTLLSSGNRPNGAFPTRSVEMEGERLDEEVKAALAMKDFFRRSDLSPQAQSKAPGTNGVTREIAAIPMVVEAQPTPVDQEPEETQAPELVETATVEDVQATEPFETVTVEEAETPVIVELRPIPINREPMEAPAPEPVEAVTVEDVTAPEPFEAGNTLEAAPEMRPQDGLNGGSARAAMERAAEVREEVVAYSSRVQRELEEARAAMLQAEKRYQELEAESKETAEKLAETIREVLQQVEGLAR